MHKSVSLKELFILFLKIGSFAFGGSYSLLSLMEKKLVEERGWLTTSEFTEGVAIGQITPGPIAFSSAVFIGYKLRRLWGAIACGMGLLIPSFLIVTVVANLYIEFADSSALGAIFRGVNPAVVGFLLATAYKTGKPLIKDKKSLVLCGAAFFWIALLNLDPILLIIISGAVGAILFGKGSGNL